jgi:phage/conjugal plasmid C-4 type zinc finger TraR family protein
MRFIGCSGGYLFEMSRGFGGSDFAQVQGDLANTLTIEQVLEQEREQAKHARDRRAQGSYGVCEDCARPIGDERLRALPDATRCVACQAAWESSPR